jgi:hypothetical protein
MTAVMELLVAAPVFLLTAVAPIWSVLLALGLLPYDGVKVVLLVGTVSLAATLSAALFFRSRARKGPPSTLRSALYWATAGGFVSTFLLVLISHRALWIFFALSRLNDMYRPHNEIHTSLEKYHSEHGAYPRRLEDLGTLPEVPVWAVAPGGWPHRHPPSRAVQIVSSSAQLSDLKDVGGWAYDPATGKVFIACTAMDPKMGLPIDRRGSE